MSQKQVGAHFTNVFFIVVHWKINFHLNTDARITQNDYTYHDSCTVVLFAKVCGVRKARIGIKTKICL